MLLIYNIYPQLAYIRAYILSHIVHMFSANASCPLEASYYL